MRGRARRGAIGFPALAVAAFGLISCGEGNMGDASGGFTAEELRSAMDALSSRKLFFGHQSVGLNILEGIGEIGSELGSPAPAVERTRTASAVSSPGLFHDHVGQNREPLAKLADFDGIMRSGMGTAADAAFLKFCYVDVTEGRDVEALFSAYEETMEGLKADFPDTLFIHFTVPIETDEGGLVGFAKGVLGRKRRGYGDNEARQRYNDLLLERYGGKEPIFDIALAEASSASGGQRRKTWKGRSYLEMLGGYSTDGGHLGPAGRRRVAGSFLVLLADALRGR